jgi:hypothetical protein
MRLKLRLERWGRLLVGQFGGDFPDELREKGKFLVSDKYWNVFSFFSPAFDKPTKTIYLPGGRSGNDDLLCSVRFDTTEEAVKAKEEILLSLSFWEQSLNRENKEEENVYTFEV